MTTPTKRSMPIVLGILSAAGPLGIDMYLPSIPDMAVLLNTNEGAIQLSLMTFFVGLILLMLACAAVSALICLMAFARKINAEH